MAITSFVSLTPAPLIVASISPVLLASILRSSLNSILPSEPAPFAIVISNSLDVASIAPPAATVGAAVSASSFVADQLLRPVTFTQSGRIIVRSLPLINVSATFSSILITSVVVSSSLPDVSSLTDLTVQLTLQSTYSATTRSASSTSVVLLIETSTSPKAAPDSALILGLM
ncbi:MAG: hypothetical protein A4E53_00043 [Pelotomaculum sp. PtaB.Bin104]|nr:MAG: hypothetical protein A4E53_00043 [Pelotomaculum sp. PtaB.Bin104]